MTRENIWKEDEYSYEAAYGFVPNLHFYLHEDAESAGSEAGSAGSSVTAAEAATADAPCARPFMIVLPGGGYCMVVPPEGEIVAKEFFARGMNCAVLTYTTDITMSVPLMRQPLQDVSRAVRYVRANAQRLGADPNKIVICGFSAGAHVCGSLAVHFNEVSDPDPALASVSNRPDAVVLSYPVITSGEFTHIYSMWALIGKDGPKDEYEFFSLEKNVTGDVPPVFMWQTVTDDLVPVENSMMFAESLRRAGVPFAYYAFPKGWHGLSVCNDAFRSGDFGEPYSMEQVMRAVEAVKAGNGIRVSETRRQELIEQFKDAPLAPADNAAGESTDSSAAAGAESEPAPAWPEMPEIKDVAMWPQLCETWLEDILK